MLITIEEEKLDAILEGAYISKFGRINILQGIVKAERRAPEGVGYGCRDG